MHQQREAAALGTGGRKERVNLYNSKPCIAYSQGGTSAFSCLHPELQNHRMVQVGKDLSPRWEHLLSSSVNESIFALGHLFKSQFPTSTASPEVIFQLQWHKLVLSSSRSSYNRHGIKIYPVSVSQL